MVQLIRNEVPQRTQQFGGFAGIEQIYDAQTIGYLEALDIAVGGRYLEVGAGGGSIARWLAERVGPEGQVVATDIDTRLLAGLADLRVPNLEVQRHDIGKEELPEQSFDLIHARLVLIHVPERQAALARLVAALKSGGWLVIEDFDHELIEDRAFPVRNTAHAALLQKMVQVLPRVMAARGHETGWGRRLYTRLHEHGLVEVGMEGRLVVANSTSPGAQTYRGFFERTRAEAVAAGLVTDQEVETFQVLFDDPEFTCTLPIMMSVWGRRP
jgi:ubiquinone/menaquinone biosynthesis C-methylase UbiE